MDYFLAALKKYAVFSGRAQRAEYWYFVLFNAIFSIAVGIIADVVGDTTGLLSIGYALAMLIPGLAVSVRRLHDIGKSGWFILIGLIPLIGAIWLIVWMVRDSDPGANAYGPNPKGMKASPEMAH
ncbi:MAG: protein of unknown function DUF805 [uncultured bacterium]|nr:MAG: protein of unknown function DUF805 [uncultured bacterium]KKT73453.1 MAG: hypothetical protein UW70_C0083G0009 [Candidatus Peregrinibacteria bacterium GW2011_GWA2_44_7]